MIQLVTQETGSDKSAQRRESVRQASALMLKGLGATTIAGPASFRYLDYGTEHLREMSDGWKPPANEVVSAWFTHFKFCVPAYSSDNSLAKLLGLGDSAGERVREYCLGFAFVPYHVWRTFLIMTGRAGQTIVPVLVNVEDQED